jgi:tetratricopeptide (TPR) repeat protein
MKGLGMKKKGLLWVVGILLLAGGGVAAALLLANRRDVTTSSRAAYDAYEEALLNQHRFYFKEARVGFAKALELDPNFAMAMLQMADMTPDHDQAVAFIRRAARQRDHLTERERYHVDIALANVDGKADRSLQLARELHAKYPADVKGAGDVARAALLMGDRDAAIKTYEDLLAADPNNADAYNQIGYYYGYRGEYDKAIDNLERYRFISRDNANPFDSLAENQANAGRYNEAIENLNRALAIKPDFGPAYWHFGVVYEGLGQWDKAIEAYDKAAELSDGEGSPREYLTMALRPALRSGDVAMVKQAVARLEKLPIDPKSDSAKTQPVVVAVVLDIAEGRAADAERRMREIKPYLDTTFAERQKAGKVPPGLKPHFPDWNFFMGRALEMQGKLDEALPYYQANANPPNPFYDFNARQSIMMARAKVAEILARKGDLDAAEKLIAENRKWNPSWAPARASEAFVAEARRAKVLAASK